MATTVVESGKVAPSFVGDASMPNYAALRQQSVSPLTGGGQAFAGQADDPFFLDIRVFDLLYGGDLSETGVDSLDGKNVNSIGLQLPTASLLQGGDPVIGVWSTSSRPAMKVINTDGSRDASGDFVQVSRLGHPLVNEVVLPAGLKDTFNALKPEQDAMTQPAVDRVNDPEVPKLIEAIYGIPAPAAPRDDLFMVFLTGIDGLNKPMGDMTPSEMLRLNTSIPPTANPNRLGVLAKDNAGFPNGRRLTDDVVDIELQALEGAVRTGKLVEALATGDGVNANDKEFGKSFPYLALPHSGTVGLASRTGGATGAASSGSASSGSGSSAPSGGVATGFGGTASSLPTVLAGGVALLGLASGLPACSRCAACAPPAPDVSRTPRTGSSPVRGVLLPGLLALPEQQRRLAAALLGVVPAALLAGAVALLVVPGLPPDARRPAAAARPGGRRARPDRAASGERAGRAPGRRRAAGEPAHRPGRRARGARGRRSPRLVERRHGTGRPRARRAGRPRRLLRRSRCLLPPARARRRRPRRGDARRRLGRRLRGVRARVRGQGRLPDGARVRPDRRGRAEAHHLRRDLRPEESQLPGQRRRLRPGGVTAAPLSFAVAGL